MMKSMYLFLFVAKFAFIGCSSVLEQVLNAEYSGEDYTNGDVVNERHLWTYRQAVCLMEQEIKVTTGTFSLSRLAAALACVDDVTKCARYSPDALDACTADSDSDAGDAGSTGVKRGKCDWRCTGRPSGSVWPCRCAATTKRSSTAHSSSSFRAQKPRPVPSKRYRLGLYDCISSYCGESVAEKRKSCIINYCHRSTVKF